MIHAHGDKEEAMMDEKRIEKVEEKVIVKGVVTNCNKLNVRRGAIITSDIRAVIDKDDIVEINEKRSTDEWYRVRTEGGIEGFCMKKYITKLP